MTDKGLGTLIFILCLVGSILYVGWLFFPAPEGMDGIFYFAGMRWAILLPVLVAVLGIALIGMWIGWTMVTTPPPINMMVLYIYSGVLYSENVAIHAKADPVRMQYRPTSLLELWSPSLLNMDSIHFFIRTLLIGYR